MQKSHTKFSLAPAAILSTDASAKPPEFFTPNLIASTSDGKKVFHQVIVRPILRQYVFKYGVQIRIANIALFPSILSLSFSLFLCRATYFPRVCCHTFLPPSFSAQKIIAECHKKPVYGGRLIMWILGCVIIKLNSRNFCLVYDPHW